MHLIFRLFVSLCISLVIGLGAAWYMISSGSALTLKSFGPWKTWIHAGDPAADPYTRAHFARSGVLPITATSAYYFKAKTDSNNSRLYASCEYTVKGKFLDVPWWSLSVYNSSGGLLINKAERYSFHKNNIFLKEDASYEITLAPQARSGNWLPTPGGDTIQLVLRVYHGRSQSELTRDDELVKNLPQIIKVDC